MVFILYNLNISYIKLKKKTMDDICEYCGLYGCDTNECILNKNNYKICECCGLTGHNKNECSFKNIVKKMDIIQKNSIKYLNSIFPDIDIFVKNLYYPIQRNIIIKLSNFPRMRLRSNSISNERRLRSVTKDKRVIMKQTKKKY